MRNIHIKRNEMMTMVTIAFSFVMLFFSIMCLVLPSVLDPHIGETSFIYIVYIIGGIGTFYFALLMILMLYKLLFKSDAVVFSDMGIHENVTAGIGAGFIPKQIILSVKLLSVRNKNYLGIYIDNPDGFFANKPASVRKRVKQNINAKLPPIVIPQSAVTVSLAKIASVAVSYTYGCPVDIEKEKTRT